MPERFLEAGKIVSTHGVRGEIKVLPWADSPEFLTRFKTFYLTGAGNGQAPAAVTVESSRVQKTVVLVKLKGVDTVEQAQLLRNRVLCIARDDPHIPAGTVFQADLIGMPVRSGGEEIGKITEILTMPASDVWVVKGAHEYMIPQVKAFVPDLDLSRGWVEVNLIEGMQTEK